MPSKGDLACAIPDSTPDSKTDITPPESLKLLLNLDFLFFFDS